MLLLVFDQLLLRGLYLHLQVDKLLRKPVRSLHGRFETRFEVLLDIGVNQRIYDMRGQILIGAAVMDIDDARIRPERNLQAPLERRQQFRGAGRVRLERSEEHTSELQSLTNLVCRLLLEKKNTSIGSSTMRRQASRRAGSPSKHMSQR